MSQYKLDVGGSDCHWDCHVQGAEFVDPNTEVPAMWQPSLAARLSPTNKDEYISFEQKSNCEIWSISSRRFVRVSEVKKTKLSRPLSTEQGWPSGANPSQPVSALKYLGTLPSSRPDTPLHQQTRNG